MLLLALCLSAAGTSAEAAQDAFGDAVVAYRAGDHGKALEAWRALADEANPLAQYNVGLLHYQGHGTTRSYAQALIWFHAAARQGLAASYLRLGAMFEHGEGVPRDFEQSYLWYTLAVSAFGPGPCRDMALDRRRLLAEKLTEAQVLKVLAESSEWTPGPLAGDGQPCFKSIAVRPADEAAEATPAAVQESEKRDPLQAPASTPGMQHSPMAAGSVATEAPSTETNAPPAAPLLMSKLPAKVPVRIDPSRQSASASAETQRERAPRAGGTMPTVDVAQRDVHTVKTPGDGNVATAQPIPIEAAPPRRRQANASTPSGPAIAGPGTVGTVMPSKPMTRGAATDSDGAVEKENMARATPPPQRATPSGGSRAGSDVYVQLGALSTREMADRVWRGLQKRNGDMFRGQSSKVETARMKSGKILYRLLTGPFDSGGKADAFCNALKKREEACFVPRKSRRK